MKFKEVYEEWADFKKNYVKKSSFSAYMLLTENHLLPDFGEAENEITEHDVQKFVLKKLQGGLARKTVKDILIVFKMILKYGKKNFLWEIIPPFEDIIFPADNERHTIDVLSVSDFKKAVAYTKENFTFRNLGVLLTLSTGIRIGEVCGLKWNDIDLERGTLTVRRTVQRIYIKGESGKRYTELIIDTPKTKSSNREIPLSHDLIKIFKSLEKIVNPEFYVLTNAEKTTEPRTYRSYYKELMRKMGLPVIKFHSLRHTFATQCIAAKIDVKTVSVLLGHSNISTTFSLYVHPDMGQKKNAINQLFKAMK